MTIVFPHLLVVRATCFALLLVNCSALASADELPAPHILLVVADDLRADVLSTYGGPVPTPNLDRLAQRGCTFDRATCGYPICHVSRTEMLAGRVLVAEANAGKQVSFRPDWQLWPQVFSKAGWRTAYVGKWHVAGKPSECGYAETHALYSSGGAKGLPLTHPRSATARPVTGYTGWTFKSDRGQPQIEFGVGLTPDTDAVIADGAIRAFQAAGTQPLFVHVNFTAPHDPLLWPRGMENSFQAAQIVLPENFCEQHPFDHGNAGGRDESIVPAPRTPASVQQERAVYYALVANIDAQMGRIEHALRGLGCWDQTLVIFTSDQGLALGSHGLMGKQNQYEHTANVPLIMAGPGVPQKEAGVAGSDNAPPDSTIGKRIATQCSLRDLFPTCCEIFGLDLPSSVQGRSLVPSLRGKEQTASPVFGYFQNSQRMIRTDDAWKLIWYPQAGRTQLFDLSGDPLELHDLSSTSVHAARRQQMEKQLIGWLQQYGDPVAAGHEPLAK